MNTDQNASKVISMLLLVATATLGWISFKDPGLPRVADSRAAVQVPADEQDVVARLWEDPLQAIKSDLGKFGKSGSDHTIEAMGASVLKKVGARKLCLLVVPIPDTPFPDDVETRLRLRYSAQMAFAAQGFEPDNRNALGYFKLPVESSVPQKDVYVPYEWFMQRGKTGEKPVAALVLWLPEGRLGNAPLNLLQELQSRLGPPNAPEFPFLFVVGPRSSDTLKKMVEESDDESDLYAFRDSHLRGKLSVFSPQATTPDALIGLTPQTNWVAARADFGIKLQTKFTGSTNGWGTSGNWCYFHNFIAPDDQLTDLLISELGLRGVELGLNAIGKTDDKILVLAEADTKYGRSLPMALHASLQNYRKKGLHYAANDSDSWSFTPKLLQSYRDQSPTDPQLVVYRYLRGLDQQKGYQENGKAPERSGSKTPEEALAAVLSKQGAMALGESQLDYVDRLSEELQHGTNTGTIKAVGVLGGDLYDKLILLRSLRAKFPDAVFFTTDLDARMWHPDHLRFTRNMVVASAYGISVTDPRGDGSKIPPFRDGYQVAVYAACQAALIKAADPFVVISPLLRPSLFELGRNGPLELKPLAEGFSQSGGPGTAEAWKAAMKRIVPKPTPSQKLGLSLAVAGSLLACVLIITTRKPKNWWQCFFGYRWIVGWVGFSFVLLCAFYGVTRFFAELPGGEPWAWKQGTSIWPTEMLRLFISCSVVTTFIWAWQHYVKSRTGLVKKYFLDEPASVRSPGMGTMEHSAVALFQTYISKAARGARARRVSSATIAYMLVAFGIVFLVDGSMPARLHIRGTLARGWDMCLLILSIVCFLALVFYVLDAVLISAELLYRLSGEETVWPTELIKQEQAKFGVLEHDLPGYLDVRFAAEKSQETGRLILIPFVIQFLFILSRNSYFDNWTWPGTLIAIFVCNILLACTGWMLLRGCAKKIRSEAIKKVKESLDVAVREINATPRQSAARPTSQGIWQWLLRWAGRTGQGSEEVSKDEPKPKDRQAGLLKLQGLIEAERRGAYADFFQDPALLAVLLPSGVFGILTVLFRALFGGM